MKNYTEVLSSALAELNQAIEELLKSTFPYTPLPRPKVFVLAAKTKTIGEVSWPSIDKELNVSWRLIRQNPPNSGVLYSFGSPSHSPHLQRIEDRYEREKAAKHILRCCDYQPRLTLRALRRIQAATAWCYARTEGRKRMAEEIVRQQSNAVEVLDAEMALQALK